MPLVAGPIEEGAARARGQPGIFILVFWLSCLSGARAHAADVPRSQEAEAHARRHRQGGLGPPD
eukprot:1474249-Pyramimonas_sp.AAC.1